MVLICLVPTDKVENSHRVLRGEGDQNITMDKLLEQFGVKPVSGNIS